MTPNILLCTPFGFVAELPLAGCYHTDVPYIIALNGKEVATAQEQVFAIFGLQPATSYHVELKGLDLAFDLETQAAGFVLNIREYGAAGDGVANDTAAINGALYTAPVGGVVRVPKGEYKVDGILLRSGVDLYLEEGAVLRHNSDRRSLGVLKGYQRNYDHTAAQVNASWEGNPLDCYMSVLYGKDVERVRIYGAGTIDGNGLDAGWWDNPKVKKTAWRPRNLFLNGCGDITVAGITSRNSAAWNLHPIYSDRLKFYCLKIQSSPDSPNTDGLNPESCRDVEIVGCHFQVGDDCIAVKSGKLFMSRRYNRSCRDIAIRRCYMEEGHGGVVIGSEISCGASNVVVERCLFERTDRGLRIKTRRGRGSTSVIEGVRFSNVEMRGVKYPFVVNMFYNCDPDGKSDYVRSKEALPVTDETPAVRDIVVEGVTAEDITGCGVFLYGLPEENIRQVRVENSSFSFARDRITACPAMMEDPIEVERLGVFTQNVRDFSWKNNKLEGSCVCLLEGKEEAL